MDGWWSVSYIVLWVLVVLLIVIVIGLARQIGTLHLRLGPRGALEMDAEGPELGDLLPPQETEAVDGTSHTIGGPGQPQLLLFVSPGCGVCEQVLPSVSVVARIGDLAPFVLTDVDAEETRLVYGSKRLDAPLMPASSFLMDLSIPGTPYVVITDARGIVVAKGTVNNLEQMEGLVSTARDRGKAVTSA